MDFRTHNFTRNFYILTGEAPTAIATANGLTKVSCIDPRDPNAIEGFTMPDMSDGEDEPGCQGATVCLYILIPVLCTFDLLI